MSNYTTQTAALKATSIDTRKIDAKQIDTKKLFIDGISIDEKLKQAAIASRGNLLLIQFHDGVVPIGVICVKDGLFRENDEWIFCYCEIIHDNLGDGEKKYLKFTHENGDSVFNVGTTVNKCIAKTSSNKIIEIQLKEIINVEGLAFELGEVDDNLEEIYGGVFYNGYVHILYQDNALTPLLEQHTSASTYSLRGENTSRGISNISTK